MKRLTAEEKARYTTLARRRSERHQIRTAKKKQDKNWELRLRTIRKARYDEFSSPIYNLEVPSVLSLSDNYDEVVRLVGDLRQLVLSKRFRVGMDFSNVEVVKPAAALYLAAEIYRCRYYQSGTLRVTGRHPNDLAIAKFLSDMGFNKLLRINDPEMGQQQAPVSYIEYSTATEVNGELAMKLRQALEAGGNAFPGEFQRAIFEALTEAMSNVLHHAYPVGELASRYPMSRRWWMAGSIDQQKAELMMMFYDQGIGIPVTLPRNHPIEIWGGLLSELGLKSDDGAMIKAATMLGRTGTEEEHRGFGLNDIIRIIRLCDVGELRILSNRGEYAINNSDKELIPTGIN